VIIAMLVLLSPAMRSPVLAVDSYRLLKLDGAIVKWGRPKLGTGAAISYAIVKSRRWFSDARNCRRLEPLSRHAQAWGITPRRIRTELKSALRAWEDIANVRFHEALDSRQADILVGVQGDPRGRAFANVWHTQKVARRSLTDRRLGGVAGKPRSMGGARNATVSSIKRASICLNPGKPWKIGFDGNLDVYDLRFTFMHEIGHALGIDHSERRDQLMHFKYDESRSELQAGDIAAVVKLYGQPNVQPPAAHQ
jgi:hypothetical protein